MASKKRDVEQKRIIELKKRFLEYYSEVPNKSLAADSIGRHINTINGWESDDPQFCEDVMQAKAAWTKKKVNRVKDDKWLLERMLKGHFAERKELTGEDGKQFRIEVINGKGYTIPTTGKVIEASEVDHT